MARAATTDLVWDDVRAIRAKSTRARRARRRASSTSPTGATARRHEAFFPDAPAVRAKARMLLSRHPHIRGVYAWLMGQEDPRAWHELARLLHTDAPGQR